MKRKGTTILAAGLVALPALQIPTRAAQPVSHPQIDVRPADTAGTGAGAKAIGEATMRDDETIVVNLYRGSDCEGPFPQPHAQFVYPPSHPRYQRVLEHLGGLKPGESKLVPPWPDDIDDARVEESVAAYLEVTRGWDEHSYEMCIEGTKKDGSIAVSVYRPDPDDPKKQIWLSLVISKDDYEVRDETAPR